MHLYSEGFLDNTSHYRLPALTKQVALEFICSHIGVMPTQVNAKKLPELPINGVWKHACKVSGVIPLANSTIFYGTTPITFAVCTSCRTIHYYYEK